MTPGSLPPRHRADGPASTPIRQITTGVGSALTSPAAARSGVVLAISSGLVAGAAVSADAATRHVSPHQAHLAHLAHKAHRAHPTRHGVAGVIGIASRYLGVPYRYGGSTPRGFDCSGFVQYVYARLGVRLPRTAQQQYNATRHIRRSQARPGDLVFFFVGGRVTHVGIYAGGNMMIAAPHRGQVVHRQAIYSANVAFGRA